VLIACLQEFAARMDDLRRGDLGLLDQWRAYCLLTGRHVEIDLYGTQVSGRCLGIDSDGALIVRGEGQDHRCLGGIVRSFGERRFGASDVDTA
jgi:biotin-(acetyl-CoA carboxylase) ligase